MNAPVPGGVKSRVLTALVLALVVVVVLLVLPPLATLALLALAIVAGAWEWSRFLGTGRLWVRVLYLALVAVAFGLAWTWTRDPGALRVFLLGTGLWWLVALAWLSLAPGRGGGIAAAVAGMLVLVPTGVAFAQIRMIEGQGAALALFTLLLVAAADTGAFFAGRRFGRVKLAPRVSPGKTWEGAFGGLCLALAIGALGAVWFDVPVGRMLVIALTTAVFSIVGDLTESMFKRHAGLKDSGSIFPGHGGVLDRIDSLSAGAPVLLLGLIQAGAAP